MTQPYEEKRQFQRQDYNCPLNLFRMDQQDQNYYAEMVDYSEGGVSLLTKEKLVIGQFLYLETNDFNKKYCGIVKWKSPVSIPGSQANGLYRYGVEYSRSEGYRC